MGARFSVLGSRIILIFVILLSGCQKKGPAKNEAAPVIPVKVMKVKLTEIVEALEYTGDIKAEAEAIVYPRVSGKVLEKIKEEGSLVNKGEPILYLDRDEVGLKFEKAPVESPLTGVVGRVFVDIGENVTPQTEAALVVNMDKVRIALDIPEVYLPRVSLGQKARVTIGAYPDEVFTGELLRISPVLDTQTRSAPVEIAVDNPKRLLNPGMFALVSLVISERKGVPVILKEGIIGHEPELYVFVIKDNKALLRKITLGIRQGQYYEVTAGLEEGEAVAVLGQQRLSEGSRVIAEEMR